jgi:hypothetical protein
MQTDRGPLWSRFCVDVLSDLSLPMLEQPHCACSLNAFAQRFALHPLLRLRNSYSHAFAHVCVRPNVQMACPEHAMPQAWLALVGRQVARDAAPPGHRRPVPTGRGKVQGKIKGRGTRPLENPVCTWGWRGTRQGTAPCRESEQCHIGIGEGACLSRPAALILDGGTA